MESITTTIATQISGVGSVCPQTTVLNHMDVVHLRTGEPPV